ncbi:MAG: HDOD domain-containing protein [Desulfobacula sp.]|nr:HDOD domain-containing protein [Desulfobacula sp.]
MENTLVGEKTIAFSIAQEILSTSVKIPTIPSNGRKIMDLVRQPEDKIDIPSFVKLVESDPGLLIRILQLSNSSFYSEMDKIISLRAAITRIGLIETVNTVSLHFFQKMLPRFPDIQGFSYDDFWSHSWVCAVANRRLGHPNLDMGVLPGDLYMSGMLHGLGKLLLAIHFPEKFSKCIKQAQDNKQPLRKIELDEFGTTDAFIAARVLNAWHFPAMVCEGVAFHQIPELASPEYIIIAGLTQFAQSIAEHSEIGCSGNGAKLEMADTFFGQKPAVKISQKKIQKIIIREVLESVEDKKVSVTADTKKAIPPAFKTKKISKHIQKNYPDPPKKSKKGVFGWVKKFLT